MVFIKRYNKYKAEKQTFDGRSYHSKKEADYAVQLAWLKKAGEIKEIIPQYKIKIVVNNIFICAYIIDFLVTLPDGRKQYIECKGYETDVWKLKWKLCMALKDQIDPGAEWIIVK